MKEQNPRLLLTHLRSGNYAHPGDTDAIDIFLNHLNQHQNTTPLDILDLGCGRGGTANYIKDKKSNVASFTAIDIDEVAITEARSLYSHIDFNVCDINDIDQLNTQKFDLIYMFSVFYALPKLMQQESLTKFASIARDGAILGICDYIRLGEDLELVNDLAGKPMKPPLLGDLKLWLSEAGWELVEVVDLSTKYRQWYSEFLEKLSNKKDELLLEFTEGTVDKVTATFQLVLNKIDAQIWGGNIIFAKLARS